VKALLFTIALSFMTNLNLKRSLYLGAGLQKLKLYLLLVLPVLLFSAASQPAGSIEPITLRAELLPFTPKEFYIAEVVDARKDRKAVASLIPATHTITKPAPAQAVDLKGGGLVAIREFVGKSVPKNTKLRPVTVRLQECRVTEVPLDNGRVEGRITVEMSFDLKKEGGESEPLVAYRGGTRYIRSASQLSVVEPTLRRTLADALTYLKTWMNTEAGRNEKLANSIKVHITDDTRYTENDTVFYNISRPLVWDDFRGSPSKPNNYAAAVFPGFAYEGHSKVVGGVVQLYIDMKVYVLKSSSWVKAGQDDAYSLNHEQRHFDIVKLVVERFKQKIQPDSLTVEDYDSMIQYKYLEAFKEMNHLQDQYDGETHHGTDTAAQEQWNQRIDKELRAFGVKK
jgi:hypothetical protein